jgi:hypothetical protein
VSPEDSGLIIDFIQNRRRLSLGAVTKELRSWSGRRLFLFPPSLSFLKTVKDRIGVESQFARHA